jgi:hypothetical protein
MHELDALADLAHDRDARLLGQREVIADNPFQQLAAVDTVYI